MFAHLFSCFLLTTLADPCGERETAGGKTEGRREGNRRSDRQDGLTDRQRVGRRGEEE